MTTIFVVMEEQIGQLSHQLEQQAGETNAIQTVC